MQVRLVDGLRDTHEPLMADAQADRGRLPRMKLEMRAASRFDDGAKSRSRLMICAELFGLAADTPSFLNTITVSLLRFLPQLLIATVLIYSRLEQRHQSMR